MKDQPQCSSWGLTGQRSCDHQYLRWRTDDLPLIDDGNRLLPFGNGRSYGDSCLNRDGISLDIRSLNHFIAFDPKSHIFRCESGVMLADLIDYFVPKGWMLPVTPSTKYVTVGGAIANDVHGKNHHRRGSFGNHVVSIVLRRSSGETISCSRTHNEKLFHATVGGLGLTGVILQADIMLMQIDGNCIKQESRRFQSLEEFVALSRDSHWKYEYLRARIDCSRKNKIGRGVLIRANHSNIKRRQRRFQNKRIKLPCVMPDFVINNTVSKLINSTGFYRHPRNGREKLLTFDQFFYPMDRVENWNWIYGKKGFFQYQCVVPFEDGDRWLEKLLKEVAKSEIASPMAELKLFGDIEAKGLLSFPRRGVSLSVDFPNRGSAILGLFERLDTIVANAKGAVYPAKDARMSAQNFKLFFPQLEEFKKYVDPKFSSTFWRRVVS